MTIDWWTLGLEAVNVAVLMWLLARFFWRPLAAMIEERRIAAAKDLAEAAAQRAEAGKEMAEITATRAGLAKEREAMLVAAAGEADKEHAARLAQAMTEIEALRTAAHAALVKQKDAASKAWREQATKLAVDIAGRLVAEVDAAALRALFLDGLMLEIQKLPEAQRRSFASETLQIVSARALDPREQSLCSERLAAALGQTPTLSFANDPALIAGLALHGSNLVVGNNWRGDLDRILADLSHDG
jgi:F-type H+-transporting ATPase subunit b